MKSHPALLASLLLGLWALAWLALGTGGCSTGWPANTPIDRDGDGLPDYVHVDDFDRDGTLEMDDLQAAMDALTDPGPKTLEAGVGIFRRPQSPGTHPGRTHALLELRSHTTLTCASTTATVLEGPRVAAGHDYAVVANDDHTNGNEEVWIRSCQIDGGAPDTYAANTFPKNRRMGVFFRRTRNSGVADSFVHDTVHTGLYTSNSSGDQFLRNRVEDAGGYGDTSGTWRQPCIYLFAFGGGVALEGFRAADNTLLRCGHSGLNTRAEDTDAPGDVVRGLVWERNTVEETLSQCINLRGVEDAVVRDLTCHSGGAVSLSRGFGSGYRESGNDNASANVLIEDVVVTDTDAGQAGLDVGAWVDGLVIRRVAVMGTRDPSGAVTFRDCAWIQRPLRSAVFEDLTLAECGRSGLVVSQLAGGLGDASETLTLRRLAASEVDQSDPLDTSWLPGVEFLGAQSRLLLEDLTLAGASGPELRFGGALASSTLRRIEIDSVDPGWIGAFPQAAAPVCDATRRGRWIVALDGANAADCSFPAGTGVSPVRCGCAASGWAPITWGASPGIELAGGVTHANVALEDVSVANARGVTGVRVRGLLSAFSVTTLLGIDDSPATDLPQRSAIDFVDATSGFSVSGATCVGTQAGVPCVE